MLKSLITWRTTKLDKAALHSNGCRSMFGQRGRVKPEKCCIGRYAHLSDSLLPQKEKPTALKACCSENTHSIRMHHVVSRPADHWLGLRPVAYWGIDHYWFSTMDRAGRPWSNHCRESVCFQSDGPVGQTAVLSTGTAFRLLVSLSNELLAKWQGEWQMLVNETWLKDCLAQTPQKDAERRNERRKRKKRKMGREKWEREAVEAGVRVLPAHVTSESWSLMEEQTQISPQGPALSLSLSPPFTSCTTFTFFIQLLRFHNHSFPLFFSFLDLTSAHFFKRLTVHCRVSGFPEPFLLVFELDSDFCVVFHLSACVSGLRCAVARVSAVTEAGFNPPSAGEGEVTVRDSAWHPLLPPP